MKYITDKQIWDEAEKMYPEYPDCSTHYGTCFDPDYEDKQDCFIQGAEWMRKIFQEINIKELTNDI